MTIINSDAEHLARRLAEAEATITALLSGEIDAVVDPTSRSPVLLSKAQAALRDSEERYRQIVDTTSDGIVKVDSDAVVTFANRQFAHMLGYEPDEIVGVSVFAFMSAAARPNVEASLARRRDGVRDAVDAILLHKNGSEIFVNVAGSPLQDADGNYVGSLAVVRDVTEQKSLHRQVMVSDRMASVGTLAAGVAHEINNPLAALMVNLTLISDGVHAALAGSEGQADERTDRRLADAIKAPLQDACEAAERVRSIVRDLKIFSHSPAEDGRSIVEVQATMESALRMASTEIRHRARLVTQYGQGLRVEVNEGRLGQVFLNLVVNAAQALPEGRAEHNTITVRTSLVEDRVVIEVQDTGPGIPQAIIDRIFDAFFTTKEIGAGTGLGLAIALSIVTDMKGSLTVSSELGKGSTFRVSLPVALGVALPAPAAAVQTPTDEARRRVLVVDDDPLVLRGMNRILAKDHEVVTEGSAQDALARVLKGDRFEVIVCDLMMPNMTGMELHAALSTVAPDQADRMVFVTGGAFTSAASDFLAVMPNKRLEKPFGRDELRAVVRRRTR